MALALGLLGSGTLSGSAEAAAGCAGRKVRTLEFATGEVRVYRSGHNKCAVTVAKRPGSRTWMSVSVQARGSKPLTDSGFYRRQAGPVTVRAAHRCVRVKGTVGSRSTASGWILC
ncbi:hypothetical protein GUY61_22810 [Streptomyces sp. GC420]|nr:hypothetical protein [Streptomyces sp. GC420]